MEQMWGFVVVDVVIGRLKDGFAGFTDGRTVWADDRLNAEQLLCTLMHELVHVERGHTSHQSEDVELEVRYEVARRLLPLDRIVGVCKDNKPVSEIAAQLGVTRRVLMDRAATLTDEQAKAAGCYECLKCPAIAARNRNHA